MAIVAGVGAPSTRETITLSREAAQAGADFVMVMSPGYYASSLIANPKTLSDYFVEVADSSPVPMYVQAGLRYLTYRSRIIYNFPSFSGGIDMSSDQIVDIVKRSRNVCGVKLTCANVGKLTRITALTHDTQFMSEYPRHSREMPFTVIDGFIDFLLPSALVQSGGAISGLANIAPVCCPLATPMEHH